MNLRPDPATSWYHSSRLPLLALTGVMIAYVILRAVYVSFTHDEAYTFFNYILRPIESTLNVTYTNNHLLNSLLARWSHSLFGDSEFALRLPNVLGGVLFFVFAAKLLSRMHANRWMVLIAFVLFASDLYAVDFLALCRGYGISLGLLLASLYCQFHVFTGKRFFLYETAAIALTATAVVSNYTLFNFFLLQAGFNGCVAVYRLIGFRKDKKLLIRYGLAYLLLAGGVAYFLVRFLEMILKLNDLGNFNFGGDTGFWSDSVRSLAELSCYFLPDNGNWVSNLYLPLMAAVILIAAAAICVHVVIRKKWSANSLFTIFLFLVITGCGCAIWLQHVWLQIPYSKDRTVVYFIPLVSLLAISILFDDGIWKWPRRISVMLFFLPVAIAQFSHINLNRVLNWPADTRMEEASNVIINQAEHAVQDGKPIGVAMAYDIYPSFSYYAYRKNCYIVQPVLYDHVEWWKVADLAIDYMYDSRIFCDTPYNVVQDIADKQIKQRQTPVKTGPARLVGTADFENNELDNRQRAEGYNSRFSDHINSVGYPFSRTIHDSLVDSTGGNLYLVSFCIMAEETPVHVQVILSMTRNGQAILWQSLDASLFVKTPGEWQYAMFRICPDMPLLPGDKIDFYILNDAPAAIRVDDLRVEEFRAE